MIKPSTIRIALLFLFHKMSSFSLEIKEKFLTNDQLGNSYIREMASNPHITAITVSTSTIYKVFIFNNTGNNNQAVELSPMNEKQIAFIYPSIAVGDDTIFVGDFGEDNNAGACYIFDTFPPYKLKQKLKAPKPEPGGNFGLVAVNSENTLLVGSTFLVEVFMFNKTSWVHKGTLRNGHYVSITKTHLALITQNAIYMYENKNGSWEKQQDIEEYGILKGILFNDLLAVSTYKRKIHIYELQDAKWILTWTLDGATTSKFGQNGLLLTTDLCFVSDIGNYNVPGEVHVFERLRDKVPQEWILKHIIRAAGGSNGNQFGHALSFANDFVMISAPLENRDTNGNKFGAVYKVKINKLLLPVVPLKAPSMSDVFVTALMSTGEKDHADLKSTLKKINQTMFNNSTSLMILAEDLKNVVIDHTTLTDTDSVHLIIEIMAKIAHMLKRTGDIELGAKKLFQTYSSLLTVAPKTLIKAESKFQSCTKLLNTIEVLSEKLSGSLSPDKNNITIQTKNFALQVLRNKRQDFTMSSHLTKYGAEIVNEDIETNEHFLASVYIPTSMALIDKVIYGHVYLNNSFFIDTQHLKGLQAGITFNRTIPSAVLSLTFEHKSGLSVPIFLKFRAEIAPKSTIRCGFWVFGNEDVLGRWSSAGCELVNISSTGIATCKCTHLTNFALIMDIYQTRQNPYALSIITWIGCGLSLVGLISTIVILSSFQVLRAKLVFKLRICMSVSLVLLLILFLIGAEWTKPRGLCQTIASFIHYFVLTSFSWMLIEGANVFRKVIIVTVINRAFTDKLDKRYFHISFVLAWCLPLFLVLATSLSSPEDLGDDRFCIVRGSTAYYSLYFPVLAIVLCNFCVLFSVLYKLAKRKAVGETRGPSKVRTALILTTVLGLTWVMCIFAIKRATLTFQVLFTIFNSLQGVFIFLTILVDNDVRKTLKGIVSSLRCCKTSKRTDKYSSQLASDYSVNATKVFSLQNQDSFSMADDIKRFSEMKNSVKI